MYTLHDYARMIADEGRMGPYARALESVVRTESVVADIGTGTGILALVACRLGAKRVYAIDTNDAVEVGRELACENGYADRIIFIQKDAREVDLPERVDVVVSDLRGRLPLHDDHLAVIADARVRFLKPNGVIIPASDKLMVAVVEQPDLHEWALGPLRGPKGVTLEAARARLLHAICSDREGKPLAAESVLSEAAAWVTLDYANVGSVPFAGRVDLRIRRTGIGHGLAVWFEATLTREQAFTTAPGHELCYGRYFLPWPRPVDLGEGDFVSAELWAHAAGDPWGWNSIVKGATGERESFKQSSFLASSSRPSAPMRDAAPKDGGVTLSPLTGS